MKKNRILLSAFLLSLICFTSCRQSVPASGEPAGGAGREGKTFSAEKNSITVCVDAGHGFDDIGTTSAYLNDVTEKDITLDIALLLKHCLEENGFLVILTHDGTAFPKTKMDDGNNLFNPKERISYVDTLDIDYFVSIHCDSYEDDESVRGTRVYYSKGTDFTADSAKAAAEITDALNGTFPDAKETVTKDMTQDSAYYVIRHAQVASSLIEVGFVTNREDATNMQNETWRADFALAVAEGIYAFFAE